MKNTLLLVTLLIALEWNLAEAGITWPGWPRPPVRPPSTDDSTLRLVHVLFRHGNRNPEAGSIWEGNPYNDESFYPEGYGQLTNAGKLKEYNLGKFFRTRYDSLLGDTWNINYVDFRSTDVNRTKMSGLLVMAGLWPPTGSSVWNRELLWQPIPYNYVAFAEDSLLATHSCPTLGTALGQALGSPEIQDYFRERYGDAMEIVSKNTGIDAEDFYSAFGYFDVMKVQDDLGLPFDDWVHQVYPEPLNSLAVDLLYVFANTTNLRQILAGNFVKKIIDDSQSFIKGTLSPSSRKLFVYSAHDVNVAAITLSLEAYAMTKTPPYGSTIIFEVHEIRGVWGLKLFYIDYTEGSPHPLAIPGCNHFCPIDQFYSLVEEILPTRDVCYSI